MKKTFLLFCSANISSLLQLHIYHLFSTGLFYIYCMYEPTDWYRLLMNDLPASFLLEVLLRSFIMFFIILLALRTSGKRGIKQLSVLELVLIIGLGSAAGDPMFYEDVGLIPATTVFVTIILLYLGVTKLTDKFRWLERTLEGEPVYIIQQGKVITDTFKKIDLSQDELFSELRILNVEHLGQVKTALVEVSGELSVLFYPDEEVKPGLPIFPASLNEKTKVISESGQYACSQCGQLQYLEKSTSNICPACTCTEWVKPIASKRIA